MVIDNRKRMNDNKRNQISAEAEYLASGRKGA